MTTVRNVKVRRRIAAGKLRLRIRDLRNLGPRSEQMLARIGIGDVETLRRRGGLAAYLALRRAGAVASVNLLWALVGALEPWPEGTDWRAIAAGARRLPLLLAIEQAEAERAPRRASGSTSIARPARQLAVQRDRRRLQGELWAPGLPFTRECTDRATTPRAGRGRRRSGAA